jgi:predicted RNA-binding Zn-ribbon protein involved in translation (DUF1610 family)
MNPLLEAKPMAGKPLPSISAELREYACPTCGVCDWMVRPDGTMSCFHCLIHLQVTKKWCPSCGTMQG